MHTLNGDEKAARVEMAASMLSILEPLTAHACSWVLAGDESWLYFTYDYECKWDLARDLSMTKPKAFLNTPTIMGLVIWYVDGPVLVEIIPPNLRVSAKYFWDLAISMWKPT
jgi:hypothetical protein